jgi:glutamate synthase domain-containing protein 3
MRRLPTRAAIWEVTVRRRHARHDQAGRRAAASADARHAHYTNSAKAKTILENWTTWQTKFKKVMPVDYARALAEMAKHQSPDSTGLDVIEIGIRAAKA